ncbi:MAG: hypothetical protein U9R79_06580 [Armatimonadota bacterium]|nr:hypothetical protein [Armatimonadota bacterium]
MYRMLIPILTAVALSASGLAQDLPLRDVAYHEGFEDGDDPFEFWVCDGEYEVNFRGVTDEQAFEGDRSFKLDATLSSGHYLYWHVPTDIPAEGDLHFSARMLLGEENTASVGLGLNWAFPPTRHSGCSPFEGYSEPTGEWKLIEADVSAEAPSRARGVMSRWVEGATEAHVGVLIDRWAIFIKGRAGQRAVVYVDDVRLSGEAVEDEAYQEAIGERWEPFAEQWSERLAEWRNRADEVEEELAALPELPGDLQEVAASPGLALERAREQLQFFEEQGYARPEEVQELETDLQTAAQAPQTVRRIGAAVEEGRPMVALPVRAITNARIIPGELSFPVLSAEAVELSACRGEYESGSFVVVAMEDLDDLLVEPTDLSAEAGSIPASAVDVKIVKVWYQAGRGIGDLQGRILVPELLLNDDALVRVDTDEQHNYLRSTGADGIDSYVLCSGEDSEALQGVRPIDAETLQPMDLPRLQTQQFWVTVHVPEDTPGGQYRGALQLTSAGHETVEMPLSLTVHDFDLEPAPLIYSVYYRAKLAEDNQPTITSEWRSEEQYLAEMRDMETHGCLYPTMYQSYHEQLLPRALELRAEAGLPTDYLFTLGISTGAPETDEAIDKLRQRVRDWLAMAERFGYEQMNIYGIDEARGERLEAQRKAWAAVQDEGAGTFVACYHGTFEAMGDLLNVAVLARKPDPEEAAKFHGVGSMVFTYAFPQVGPEEPETFRRNFGLTLWKANFDGAMDYAYQHGFGHVWNDFDSDRYRDHNFTYPTLNGVVDTVQWEGFREASDDTRYVATLQAAIEQCEDAQTRDAAQQWLDALDPERDLYEVRAEMVEHIRRCLGERE